MRRVSVELPVDVDEKEFGLFLALGMYQAGRILLGKAAELAGYSYRTFQELTSRMGIVSIDYPPDQLEEDLANA